MAHPRASKHPATGNQLFSLSSEVLHLHPQALNLSVSSQKPNYSCWPCHAHLSLEIYSSQGTHECRFQDSPAYGFKQQHHSNSLSMEEEPSLDDLLSLQDCSALPPAVGSVPSPADTPFNVAIASYACYNKQCKRRCRVLDTHQRVLLFLAFGSPHRHSFASWSSTAFGPLFRGTNPARSVH